MKQHGFLLFNRGLVSLNTGDEDLSDLSDIYYWSRPAKMLGGQAALDGKVAQVIHALTETRNLNTQPFIIPDKANSIGKAWDKWF